MSKVEEFIQEHTKNGSNEIVVEQDGYCKVVDGYHPWLTPDDARGAVKTAREEIYEWLQKISFDDYKVADEESYRMGCPYDYIDVHGLINNLKQAMNDE